MYNVQCTCNQTYSNLLILFSYPLILSIENHCSVAQQHVMADYMSDILGNLLYKEPRNESLGNLPSPEELKYKILVKVRTCMSYEIFILSCLLHVLNVNITSLLKESINYYLYST